jgi:hypothetical protein
VFFISWYTAKLYNPLSFVEIKKTLLKLKDYIKDNETGSLRSSLQSAEWVSCRSFCCVYLVWCWLVSDCSVETFIQ